MTRSIQEGNVLTVLQFYIVSTDVLSNTTRLTGYHIRITNMVKQRSLTMIYVTHHRNNRAAGLYILFVDYLIGVNLLCHMRCYILGLESELFCHQVDGLGIQTLVDGDEQTEAHTGSDNLVHRHIHHVSQVICGHEFSQFENLGLLLSLHDLQFVFLALLFTTLTFVFGGIGFVLFLLQTVECLFQSLIHLFLSSLTGLVFLVLLAYLVALVVRVHFRGVILDTLAFPFLGSSLLLSLLCLLTLFTLFAFLLFGLFGRTSGSVYGIQVYLTQDLRRCLQFGFSEREYLLFGFGGLLCFRGFGGFLFRLLCRKTSRFFFRFLFCLAGFLFRF